MTPHVSIEKIDCVATADPDEWRCTWMVSNSSDAPLNLAEAWVPHGRFRGEGRVALGLTVEPGQTAPITLRIRTVEPSGAIVENAFLILRATCAAGEWRIFVRMSVQFEPEPRPRCMLISTQRLH